MFLQTAIEEGSDFIEADIQTSKDGILFCMHDVTLDATTDVAEHKEFADRKTNYVVQGVNTTGFFAGMLIIVFFSYNPHVCEWICPPFM